MRVTQLRGKGSTVIVVQGENSKVRLPKTLKSIDSSLSATCYAWLQTKSEEEI